MSARSGRSPSSRRRSTSGERDGEEECRVLQCIDGVPLRRDRDDLSGLDEPLPLLADVEANAATEYLERCGRRRRVLPEASAREIAMSTVR